MVDDRVGTDNGNANWFFLYYVYVYECVWFGHWGNWYAGIDVKCDNIFYLLKTMGTLCVVLIWCNVVYFPRFEL